MFLSAFKRYLRYIRRHKRVIIFSSILTLIILICFIYINHRINKNEDKQQTIVRYLEKNYEEQQIEKVRSHSFAIKQKIDGYKKIGNEFVDGNVLNLYVNAYALALEGNKFCYMLEVIGDDTLEAYRQGRKDGKKLLNGFNNSF